MSEDGAFYRDRRADGALIRATDRADSALLERFFVGYDRAFILRNEREEHAGFRACLALNQTLPVFAGRRQREVVLTLESEHGALLGGANFLAIHVAAGGPPVSVALNYLFVEPTVRGRGLSRALTAAVARVANHCLLGAAGQPPEPAIFIEQNDPLRLSAQDYAADTRHTGLDQVDRLAIWGRMGARIVDFPYVQPALSDDQAPDRGLLYAALRFPADAVPADYLHAHLQSYFGVSVLKGTPLASDATASEQLDALLARGAPLGLLPISPAVERLKRGGTADAGDSFRLFAREARQR